MAKDIMTSNIKVSVVIVSYNCLPFLTLCLDSLLWKKDDRMEIIVVDNNSDDGTIDKIKKAYPSVITISNNENKGFGIACNQGIAIAKGEYFLMLNPDTIVDENLVDDILSFMQKHPDAGGMGIYMADGEGKFLPESKRGFPTLFASFYKFSGLTKRYPKNKKIAKYYMGNLPNNKINEIEILAGAFMLLNSKTIEKIGGFDERFFMYGEDIDLSWRIIQNGYKNYFNPEIKIIHFKGESSIKDKKYIKNFFGAMELFYKIHFTNKSDKFFKPLIYLLMRSFSTFKKIQLSFIPKDDNRIDLKKSQLTIISNSHKKILNNLDVTFSYPDNEIENDKVVFMDMANLKPSEAIKFATENSEKNLKFVWGNSSKNILIQVLSSTENSIIENINF